MTAITFMPLEGAQEAISQQSQTGPTSWYKRMLFSLQPNIELSTPLITYIGIERLQPKELTFGTVDPRKVARKGQSPSA